MNFGFYNHLFTHLLDTHDYWQWSRTVLTFSKLLDIHIYETQPFTITVSNKPSLIMQIKKKN